jgi:uncharacterized protein YprB with RNaseH-like and TPR domain
MSLDELKKRMEALNGKPLENIPDENSIKTPVAVVPETHPLHNALTKPFATAVVNKPERQRARRLKISDLPFVSLEECLSGGIKSSEHGSCYHVERSLAEHAPWCEAVNLSFAGALKGASLGRRGRRAGSVDIHEVLFLDLETLGLSGEPLFLVGLLRMGEDGCLVCHQFLARDLSEEAASISLVADLFRQTRLLVTFNGISYDMPLLRSRAGIHGVVLEEPKAHLDILLEARQRYRRTLPNCRLQTLEEHVCEREREDDVPGAEIPRVYREYIKTGNAALLQKVIHHNLLDLATTADLLVRFFA